MSAAMALLRHWPSRAYSFFSNRLHATAQVWALSRPIDGEAPGRQPRDAVGDISAAETGGPGGERRADGWRTPPRGARAAADPAMDGTSNTACGGRTTHATPHRRGDDEVAVSEHVGQCSGHPASERGPGL